MADQFRREAFTEQSEPLRAPLNYWAREVVAQLQTIPNRQLVTIEVITAAVLANTPTVRMTFANFVPKGLAIVKAENVANPGAIPPGAVGLSWQLKQPTTAQSEIEIQAFYGLDVSTRYKLTLGVDGG